MKIKSEFIFLVAIFLFAFVLRMLFVSSVPPAIAGDELTYILNIRSYALTGEGLKSDWNIFSALIFRYPVGLPQAELPYFLLYPAINIFGLSLLTTRLTYIFISALTIIPLYLLAKELFDKKTGQVLAVIASISPWMIYIGRTTYEMVPAMFFYILATYLLLREKGWRIFIALPIFILAFYSYIGTKVAFLPLIFLVSIFAYIRNNHRFSKQYALFNLICVLFVFFFAALLLTNGESRTNELFLPSSQEIVRQVDEARRGTIAPSFISSIFINKATIYVKIIIDKVFNIFFSDYLYVASDNFVGLRHGLFYYLDAAFIILGLVFAFAKKRSVFVFLLGLVAISTLPQVFYKARIDIFSPHLTLMFPFLLFFVAYGISAFTRSFKSIIVACAIVALYAFSFANFFNMYFFQFPLQGHFDFASRELSRYVALSEERGEKVVAYVKTPDDAFGKYVYYSNLFTRESADNITRAYRENRFVLGNVEFIPCGSIPEALPENTTVIYQSGICDKYISETPSVNISRLDDGGVVYKIYNDRLCDINSLNSYPSGLKIRDFDVEKLPPQEFCRAFITR